MRSISGKFLNKIARGLEKKLYRMNLFSAERLTLPGFLGIGAQKAGTTWLFANLKRHPEIYVPPMKELHYFSHHFRRESVRAYAAQFKDAGNRLRGEISPDYCTLPRERVEFIRKIMPRCRIIFMLRNPVDRAWSQAVMNLVLQRDRAFDDVPADQFINYFNQPFSVMRGNYMEMLATWESIFPKEQIQVVFFDAILSRPKELLAQVFHFLGVAVPSVWDNFPYARVYRPHDRPKAKVDAYPMLPACREYLESAYRADIEKLYERFGPAVSAWRC